MSTEVLAEEFEVLESIYPTELTKLSEKEIEIVVEPDEQITGEEDLRLSLKVRYPESYPNVLPELSLYVSDGVLEEREMEDLVSELQSVGSENIGIAMTFTLISHLREKLLALLHTRIECRQKAETLKERLAIEAEEARTRGTPVTPESFLAWKVKFDKEMVVKRTAEQDERMKALLPKERDELRKVATRLTGRQLFEHDRNLATSDATLVEEGTVSIDVSQFDRAQNESEAEEEEGLHFSDSD